MDIRKILEYLDGKGLIITDGKLVIKALKDINISTNAEVIENK